MGALGGAVDLRYPIGPVRIKTTGEVDAALRALNGARLGNRGARRDLTVSPSRNIGIEAGMDLHHDIYTHRQYAGSPVRRSGISGTLRADYTPNGALFFVADGGGGWNTSADPDL